MKPVGILFEHPLWFEPLFAELDHRSIPHEKLGPDDLERNPSEVAASFDLIVNRMSPSAWLRGSGPAIFDTLDFLLSLEDAGVNVINGSRPFSFEVSKAKQRGVLAELGVRHPASRIVEEPAGAASAATGLRFPVLVKPNVGGSGAGIESFETPEDLKEAATLHELDFGPDSRGIIEEQLPARADSVVRVEVLDGDYLYAIRLALLPGSFNLCPADYCDLPGIADGVSGRGLPIESYQPPPEVISDVLRIMDAIGADLGGVEYLIDERDGLPYFYDINVLSNFVADAPEVIGFDPFVDLVDLIERRAQAPRPVGGEPRAAA